MSQELRHILVVERDMIVGMSLAEDLTELGFRVSGPFISSRDIGAALADGAPDAAIVDLALRDGTGPEAARTVRSWGVPFVLFSAGNRKAVLAGEFRDVPWIEKPAPVERLLAALWPTPAATG